MTEEQRRKQQRYAVDIPVEIVAKGKQVHGTAKNMSIGGMFIETVAPLALGEEVHIVFTVPSPRQEVDVKAQVRWVEKGNEGNTGIGVLFLALRAKHVWALNKFFADMQIAA